MTQQQLTAQQELDALNERKAELKRQERYLKAQIEGPKIKWTATGNFLVLGNIRDQGSKMPDLFLTPSELMRIAQAMPSILNQASELLRGQDQ